MKDEKQYSSFVIGVQRNHNDGKISTVIVGNKYKGKPAKIVSAYAGEEAQALYNILVGRQTPAIKSRNPSVAYSRMKPEMFKDNPNDLLDDSLL